MVFAEAPRDRGATWAFPPAPERSKPFEPELFNSPKLKLTGPVNFARFLSPPAPICNTRRSVRLSPLDRNGREANLQSSASALSLAASPWSVPWDASASPSASKRCSTSVPAGFVHCGAPASPSGVLKPTRYSSRQRLRKDGLSFAEIETSAADSWMTQPLPKASETISAFELDCAGTSTTPASSKAATKSEADQPVKIYQSPEAQQQEAPAPVLEEQPDTTLFPIEAPAKDQAVEHLWFSLEDLEAQIKQLHKAEESSVTEEGMPIDADVPIRVRPGEFLLWEPEEEEVDVAAEDVACCTAEYAVDTGLHDFLAEAWLDSDEQAWLDHDEFNHDEFSSYFVDEEEV